MKLSVLWLWLQRDREVSVVRDDPVCLILLVPALLVLFDFSSRLSDGVVLGLKLN